MADKTIKPEQANFRPWWEDLQPPEAGDSHDLFTSWVEKGLTYRAIKTGTAFYKGRASGMVGDNAKLILDNLEVLQLGRRVYEKITTGEEHPSKVVWAWADGGVTVDYWASDGEISVWVMTSDKEVAEKVIDLLRRYIAPRKPEGRVYVIGSGPMGPEFYNLGTASVPMERGNYEPKVIAAYDEIITDLKAPSPTGRLSIFDGPPGTGKTFLVRAILDAAPEAMFVFVLPNMVDALASPALIPLLIRRKESRSTTGPIVFILEDGDNVLTPRKKDNLSLISTLLNMTSGILGSMLDIRVIATTNSPKSDIDPALMRPGRLSQHITVGSLSSEHAAKIYKRLTGKKGKDAWGSKSSLADVYLAAKKNGWKPQDTGKSSGLDDECEAPRYSEARIVNSQLLGEDFIVYPGGKSNLLS